MKTWLDNSLKMKQFAVIFLGIFLCNLSLFSQSSKLYFDKKIDWVKLSDAQKLNPDSVFHIKISRSDLKLDLNAALAPYKQVKSLSFRGLKINFLNVEFSHFEHLTYLDLSKNAFVELPKSLCTLKSLKILMVSSNPLAELPECFGELTQLVALDCFDTELEALPESMKACWNLKYVDMQGIQLNQEKQDAIKSMFSNVRFNFDEPCDCF